MKKIFLILAGFFAVTCNDNDQTDATPKNSDLIQQNLKGKIQHLEEEPYKVDSIGKVRELDSCCIEISDFDEKGYLTRYHTKDGNQAIKDDFTYTRHENGLMKGWVKATDGKKKASLSIQLTKDGRYGDGQSYDSTGKMDAYYTNVKDNEYNLVTEIKKYKPDSTLEFSWSHMYDKNIWVSTTKTDSSGKIVVSRKAKNDEKGNIIELTRIDVKKDSTTTRVTTYKYDSYDEEGNWTQRTEYNDKGRPVKIVKRNITYYKTD